jgi:DNA-binding NarL/FixJ family response regulator
MRVLIIDDHPIIITACRAILACEDGLDIISATNAVDGLASFLAEPPEVCIIDLHLASTSGLALIQQILRRDANARIIVFSVADDPISVASVVGVGVKGYVYKSADPNDLILAIREVGVGKMFFPIRDDA